MANGSGSRGPSPQGHRARLARVGGRGGIPQKLTCIGGVHSGPSASTSDCPNRIVQGLLRGTEQAPLPTGVGYRQLVRLVLRLPPCTPHPSYRAGVGQQPRRLLRCRGPTGGWDIRLWSLGSCKTLGLVRPPSSSPAAPGVRPRWRGEPGGAPPRDDPAAVKEAAPPARLQTPLLLESGLSSKAVLKHPA